MKKYLFLLFLPLALSLNAQEDKEALHSAPEVQPEYPGGMNSLMEFLGEEIKYPKSAKDQKIEGTVFVTFVIDKSGEVRDAKVMKGLGEGCDEESLRVVNAMPDWKPGSINGEDVNVQLNLPIRFQLDDDKDLKKKE